MPSKVCGICLKGYRGKGTYTVALTPKPRRVLTCPTCVGEKTVPVLVAETATRCESCGKLATRCSGCLNASMAQNRVADFSRAIVKLSGLRNVYSKTRHPEFAEGLTMAIDVLSKGAW